MLRGCGQARLSVRSPARFFKHVVISSSHHMANLITCRYFFITDSSVFTLRFCASRPTVLSTLHLHTAGFEKSAFTQWVKHNDSILSESGSVLLLDGPASVFFGMTFSRNYVPCGSQHSVFHHDTIFVPMSPIILTSFTTPNHQLSSRKCARPTMAYWIMFSPPPPPPLFYTSPFCLTIALC